MRDKRRKCTGGGGGEKKTFVAKKWDLSTSAEVVTAKTRILSAGPTQPAKTRPAVKARPLASPPFPDASKGCRAVGRWKHDRQTCWRNDTVPGSGTKGESDSSPDLTSPWHSRLLLPVAEGKRKLSQHTTPAREAGWPALFCGQTVPVPWKVPTDVEGSVCGSLSHIQTSRTDQQITVQFPTWWASLGRMEEELNSCSSSDSGGSSSSRSDTDRSSLTGSSNCSSDSDKASSSSSSSVSTCVTDKENESESAKKGSQSRGSGIVVSSEEEEEKELGRKEDRGCTSSGRTELDQAAGGGGKPTATVAKVIEGNLGPLTATVKFINPYKNNWINADRLNELRKKVQDATKHHRVFLLRGSFHTVRRALVERGWVEKLDGFRVKAQASTSSSGFILEDLVSQLPERKPGESRKNHIAKCERSIMSRFLEHTPIDFLWTARREKADWLDLTKNSALIINRFAKAPFTTKEGLCSALHDFHWFYEEGMSETYFPRCYNVWNPEELNEFVDNFRLTASMGLLKWLIERHATEEGLSAIIADDGNVPSTCITFALTRCKEYLDYCLHNDIDLEEDAKVWDHDWDVFLTHHYLLTHEDNRIQLLKEEREADAIDQYLAEAKSVLEQIKSYWPQYALDGYLNIWIVKPGNKCRGRGIHLMNNIKQIIAMVNPPIVSKTRYVIQKYIGKPP